ncbi:hypothetical protein V2I01_36020 [Micromonospora sp. BRA006-A]|nr:hypothetical protein [Micromonospora sp. BRA006-A]
MSVLLSAGGWVAFRGWQARAHLVNAAGLARELSAQVLDGDVTRAQRTLAALQEQAAAARGETGDPVWWVGQQTPYAGTTWPRSGRSRWRWTTWPGSRSPRCCASTSPRWCRSRASWIWPACVPSRPRCPPPTRPCAAPPTGCGRCPPATS